MSEDTLLPDIPLPRRRWEITITVPRGDYGPLVPGGIPSGDGIMCALTATLTVVSVTVEAAQMPVAAAMGIAKAGDWALLPGATAEVRPAVLVPALTTRRGHDQAVVDEAARLYESGMTGKEVAAALAARGARVDPRSVLNWVKARRKGPRAVLKNGAEIVRLRDEEKLTWAEIGRRTGSPRTTVHQRYAAMKGIPRSGRARRESSPGEAG